MDNHRIFNLEIISLSLAIVLLAIMVCALTFDPNTKHESKECIPMHIGEIVMEEDSEDIIEESYRKTISTHVHMTCYQPVKSQCNSDPLHTADGSKIDLKKLKNGNLKWIAISRDIEHMFPMGSKVRIVDEKTGKDYGIYEVKDRMNKRWRHRIDILVHPSSNERISKENVKIELI